MNERPDLFTNVHKGIRQALFDACLALGRGDPTGRALLADALRFAAHHAENEDLILLPTIEARAVAVHARMKDAHDHLEPALAALAERVDDASLDDLYAEACAVTARYLEHLHEEETELEPELRAVLSDEEILAFGRGSVARTAADDQRMMLRFMFRAMPRSEVDRFAAKLPAALAAELRS